MAKKTKRAPRQTRGLEQRIAELDAKLHALRQRIAAKQDPALRHALTARKALDRALDAAEKPATRKALSEARALLAGLLGPSEAPARAAASAPRAAAGASAARLTPEALLEHVKAHPGQRGEQIAQALGLETAQLRPVMKELIAAGRVRTQGQRRGMTYTAV